MEKSVQENDVVIHCRAAGTQLRILHPIEIAIVVVNEIKIYFFFPRCVSARLFLGSGDWRSF